MINFRKRYVPKSFDEFHGQGEAINTAKTIQKRIQRDLYPTNFICYGNYGLGKTQFVEVLANTLNAKLIKRIGNEIDKDSLPFLIDAINQSTEKVVILFLDEIDTTNWRILKELNVVIESFNYQSQEVRSFIFCGATINKGKISKRNPDLLNRFQFSVLFKPYSLNEMCSILNQYANEMFPYEDIPKEIIHRIALNSKQNLRNSLTMVENYVCERDLDYILKNNQIVHEGITQKDIEILLCLFNSAKPVGTNFISSQCNLGEEDYLYDYESYLLGKNLVQRSPRRSITPKGIELLIKLGYIKDNQTRKQEVSTSTNKRIIPSDKELSVQKEKLNFESLVSEFINSIDVRESTRANYQKALKDWLNFIENNKGKIKHEYILKYKKHLISRSLSAYTITLYLNTLKLLFKYLVERNILESNPASNIKPIRKLKPKRDALNNEELDRLLSLKYDNTVEGLRDEALIKLKLTTGLRDISLSKLLVKNLKEVDTKKLLYYIPKGSDEAENFAVITQEVYDLIKKYLNKRNAQLNEPMFVSVSDRNKGEILTAQGIRLIIQRALKRAEITRPEITSHSLRHSCITLALENGCNLMQVKELAGHKSIRTTASYIHDRDRLLNPPEEAVGAILRGK